MRGVAYEIRDSARESSRVGGLARYSAQARGTISPALQRILCNVQYSFKAVCLCTACLCHWVHTLIYIDIVYIFIKPKRKSEKGARMYVTDVFVHICT